MANVEHNVIADPDIHEPKGVASATSGQVYQANGSGSGAWATLAGSDATVYVAQESDFPSQTGSTITLETKTNYVVSASFSTAKNFDCEDGSLLTMNNASGHLLTYTGSSTMFSGVDVSFTIIDARITCPSAEAFDFEDSVGNLKIFLASNVFILACTKVGTFEKLLQTEFLNVGALATNDGITYIGTLPQLAFTVTRMAMISTNVGFVGIDLGTAIVQNPEFRDLIFVAPSGAVGITGLASSGNVPTGFSGMVDNSSFSGGMTTFLQNITKDDIRWFFNSNTFVANTFEDGLLSLSSNATVTTIGTISTPVLVAGTWVVEQTSFFTGTTGGRLTYNGERDLTVPIDISVSIEPVSGTNQDLKVYLAINGSIIANSGRSVRADNNNPLAVSVIWQYEFSTTDYAEVWVENNTGTTNITVIDAALRIR